MTNTNKEKKIKKQIKEELSAIYDFLSAEENGSFGYSMELAKTRADYLEKLYKNYDDSLCIP